MTEGTDLDELLIAHAAGHLTEAAALVVATHLCLCRESRRRYRIYETLGGLLLEDLPPEGLAPDRRARVMAALGEDPPAVTGIDARRCDNPLPAPLAPYLPAPLSAAEWRRSGPLAELPLSLARSCRGRLRLLRLGPGAGVPSHGHAGIELTLVLEGRLRDGERVLEVGDLAIAGPAIVHAPCAGGAQGCLCLLFAQEG